MIESYDFNEMLEEEYKRIKARRREAGDKDPERDPGKDTAGLGLSGGGIRSATFNLGLLQALEAMGILKKMDYLSTVSGGGYIGSALTWLTEVFGKFPFGYKRKDHSGLGGKVLAWLRAHGKYLTPGEGLNIWALIGAVISGILINLLILVPFFLGIFSLLRIDVSFIEWVPAGLPQLFDNSSPDIYMLLSVTGTVLMGVFLILILYYALTSRLRSNKGFVQERKVNRVKGKLLKYAVFMIIIGTIPQVKSFLDIHFSEWVKTIMSGISVTGILSMVGGSSKAGKNSIPRGGSAFAITAGLGLAVYGLFLWFFHISATIDIYVLGTSLVLGFVLSVFADINQVSLHRFYRNRLMEAYMPSPEELKCGSRKERRYPDNFLLKDIKQTEYPYHIINTNLQAVGSASSKLSSRGGENFVFSPCFCGSDSTAFVKTEDYIGGNMSLATAFAISGAAVAPNTYATRSRPLSFIMALFNVRLDYWIRNPKKDYVFRYRFPTQWLWYILRELMGRGLNEDTRSVLLSDGGHFENLGLYELIRRRCKFIVVSDAGADKDWKFADLAKVVEMVRLDFGADICLDVSDLIPEEDGFSKRSCIPGTITYNGDDGEQETGKILFIKTSVVEDRKSLREDIYGYKRANSDFPDQSTMDQFFSEPQFEAYRELGFCVGKMAADEIIKAKWFN